MRQIRGQDKWGSGEWQASRGKRKHNGVDFVNNPGNEELAPCDGKVTKIGYPYSQTITANESRKHKFKRAMRYVQITDKTGVAVRLFYVDSIIPVGGVVKKGEIIGHAQDLTKIYSGITQHVHIECKFKDGFVEPVEYLGIEVEQMK